MQLSTEDKYNVTLTENAEDDLFEIWVYVSTNDSVRKADYLLKKLQKTILSLDILPDRGHIPPEMLELGISAYRETHCKPYRIMYEIIDATVYVHCILHGHQDLQELLERRLLR